MCNSSLTADLLSLFHLSLKAQTLLNKSFPVHFVDEETGTTKFDDTYMIMQEVSDASGNEAWVGSQSLFLCLHCHINFSICCTALYGNSGVAVFHKTV